MSSSTERLVKSFTLLDQYIEKTEKFILCWSIIIMATNTIANVLGRYVFGQSIYFSEELNEFLMVIITFMGLGYATRRGIHIRMSAIYDTLPWKAKKLIMILIALTTAIMMAVLAWYAFEYVEKVARRGRVTPALQLPLYLTYIWVVAGLAITSIQYFLTALRNTDFSDQDVYVSFSEIDSYEDPETLSALKNIKVQDTTASDTDRKGDQQ
ncbi:TRAP transporter small permease [Kiloniella sp. b19]|uniref:TRAP transporter small permease n=1 Tax=Kiloniella sp. GXU_MW_B19 TaxID=3141326 RepID=UPI0031D6C5EC